jgi:GTP-binding protein HflX
MLFATLDPTMRRVVLPSGDEIILSDTVGFISDLPTELVAAFRATLEEVLDADLIIHVRDISHAQHKEQARDVMDILHSIGVAEGAPMIEVWNKIDRLSDAEQDAMRNTDARSKDVYAISAITGEGLDRLLVDIAERLKPAHLTESLRLAHVEGKKRAWLYKEGVVDSEVQSEDGSDLTVTWTALQKERFARL